MKNKRRVSIVLAVIMSLTIFGTAYASFTDIDNNKHKDAVEQMAELGILNGYPDGSFRPEGLLNRAAAAKVAGYLLGYTEEDALQAAEWDSMFDDVYMGMGAHEWAMGWINLVAKEGVINGFPDGEYKPGDELQMVQWTAILVRILGHEEKEMSWPDDYNNKAESLGLSANMNYLGNSVVNRGQMARMTNTAIYAVEMPDGRKLIDIVDFKLEDESVGNQNDGEQQLRKVKQSVSATKCVLPAGGAQSTKITVCVTHDGSPAKGVQVDLFANVVTHDESYDANRGNQLSENETITDDEGKITVTYTSLAKDDNRQIVIKANTPDDEDPHGWREDNIYILASNEVAILEGRLTNPFTGKASPNVKLDLTNEGTGYYFWIEGIADIDGYYSFAVPAGNYHKISLSFDLEDVNDYIDSSYTGSHQVFREDGIFFIPVNDKRVESGKTYNLNTDMGVIKGVVSNLGSHRHLYIHSPTKGTYIADVKTDGSFMIVIPDGKYNVAAQGGHIIKGDVTIKKGETTDLGSLSR